MTDWRRWRTLPAGERRIVVAAVALLAVLTPLAHVRSPRRLLPTSTRRLPLAGIAEPHRVLALVQAVAVRLPWRCTCLPRALAAAWLLACTGASGVVTLAVRRSGDRLEAHAWTSAGRRPTMTLADVGWHVLAHWPVPHRRR